MSGVVDGVLQGVDSILSLRDSMGAGLKKVYFVERVYKNGVEIGGEYIDTKKQMLPSPRVVEFKSDLRIKEGGLVKEGDILLKMVSKKTYPREKMLDGSSCKPHVELLYLVGDIYYRVVNVQEKHVVWSILLRRLSTQGA